MEAREEAGRSEPSDLAPLSLEAMLPGLRVVPIRHGSQPFAEAVRAILLQGGFRRIALDLPPVAAEEFLEAVRRLPTLHAVTWLQAGRRWVLPADPCDATVVAARFALAEHLEIVFLDSDAATGPEDDPPLPDPAVVPALGASGWAGLSFAHLSGAREDRLALRASEMARRLRVLPPAPTLAVVRAALLPGLLAALAARPDALEAGPLLEVEPVRDLELLPLDPRHALFALGEWPFVAQETLRRESDPFAAVPDPQAWTGLLYAYARRRLLARRRTARLGTRELKQAVRLARRLARLEGELAPDLWDVVQAARGCAGDAFAAAVLEAATHYGLGDPLFSPSLRLGPDRSRVPGESESRPWSHRTLPRPRRWTTVKLKREPTPAEERRWIRQWKDGSLCSHVPEDFAIERFHTELRERAKAGAPGGHPVSRPFESSLLDGLDLRETVRHAWKGELWVREVPPRALDIDATVILFDVERDVEYPHRGTWYAEHVGESTLVFYASNPADQPIGPGILRSRYGGLGLLFPPRWIPDVFDLPRPPLEAVGCAETLLASICLHARTRAVAYAAWDPPPLAHQAIAHRAGKRLVHVPLSGFPAATIERLRTFHVLNGKEVRSWADRFIRGE